MTAPNDTTKFGLAFLIIWLLVTVVLIVLVLLRKLSLPNVLGNMFGGNKIVGYVFFFLQLVIFVFCLAALADDSWSQMKVGSDYLSYGLTSTHKRDSSDAKTDYSCDGLTGDIKDTCGTIRAAGAWVLIFGLVDVIVSMILTIVIGAIIFVNALQQFDAYTPILVNLQWVCILAQMLIWAISGHNVFVQYGGSYDSSDFGLGASWALIFIVTLFSLAVAMFYANGTKGTGATSVAENPQPQHTQQQVPVNPPV